VKDTPGKPYVISNLIVTLPGGSSHGKSGGVGNIGAGGQPRLHHQPGEDVADHHQQPGHMYLVHDGHVKDTPGKPYLISNRIVPLPGSSSHGKGGGAGDVQGVRAGGIHHECDGKDGQGGDVQVQREGSGDHGVAASPGDAGEQQQLGASAHGQHEQCDGGHHDEDQGKDQVRGGVRGEGVHEDDLGRGGIVLAMVKDGYGGTTPKRRYWKRNSTVPDGLVQKRIDQFSVSGQNSGNGAQQGNSNGKRKWDNLDN
jgi:hypothetical protein